MPPGGDGYYYFSAFFLVNPQRYAIFDIVINGRDLCSARGDTEDATDEETQTGCSATTYAMAGSQLLITAHKRSLQRLCFYRCVSVHGRACVVVGGVHGCGAMHGCRGGIHGCRGVCMVVGGMHGGSMHSKGRCGEGGMCGKGGCAWQRGHA